MSFAAVSYWTGDRYAGWAKGLALSAKAVGVPIQMHQLVDTGNWQENTLFKPDAILFEMDRQPGVDVLWVDADCTFVSYPSLFDQLDRQIHTGVFVEAPARGQINGSLSFHRNNAEGRRIVELWKERNRAQPQNADDHNLLDILLETGMQKVECLPPSYCWNERLMRHRFPSATPVIEMHFVHMLAGK